MEDPESESTNFAANPCAFERAWPPSAPLLDLVSPFEVEALAVASSLFVRKEPLRALGNIAMWSRSHGINHGKIGTRCHFEDFEISLVSPKLSSGVTASRNVTLIGDVTKTGKSTQRSKKASDSKHHFFRPKSFLDNKEMIYQKKNVAQNFLESQKQMFSTRPRVNNRSVVPWFKSSLKLF